MRGSRTSGFINTKLAQYSYYTPHKMLFLYTVCVCPPVPHSLHFSCPFNSMYWHALLNWTGQSVSHQFIRSVFAWMSRFYFEIEQTCVLNQIANIFVTSNNAIEINLSASSSRCPSIAEHQCEKRKTELARAHFVVYCIYIAFHCMCYCANKKFGNNMSKYQSAHKYAGLTVKQCEQEKHTIKLSIYRVDDVAGQRFFFLFLCVVYTV